jgi:hypothetical protein
MAKKDGRDALWTSDSIGRLFTTDLPYDFPEYTFQDGRYWCKAQLIGGVTKMAIEGSVVEFGIAATWQRF